MVNVPKLLLAGHKLGGRFTSLPDHLKAFPRGKCVQTTTNRLTSLPSPRIPAIVRINQGSTPFLNPVKKLACVSVTFRPSESSLTVELSIHKLPSGGEIQSLFKTYLRQNISKLVSKHHNFLLEVSSIVI